MSDFLSKQAFAAVRPRRVLAIAALLALAACASDRSAISYHGQESTLGDAQAQAQGRATARSPSQLQLGFGEDARKTPAQEVETAAEKADKAAIAATIRPLREAKTFLGTLPCLPGGACQASRMTLTLAPNGSWRARFQDIGAGASAQAIAQQGCWEVIGTQPWRIRLQADGSAASTARFSFVNDNQLRVLSVNDHQPLLDYHLTRQADIDGIKELDATAAPVCR